MKKIMKKIMSYMLITAVLITNLALVPVAASQEDATEEGKQQEASGEPGDTNDSGKVPAAKDGQTDKVEKPTAVPEPATYKAEQIIELACSTQNAVIYYTTDGTTEPSNNTADSNIKQYDPAQKFKVTANTAVDPAVAATTTVKAVAYVGENKSETETFRYTIDPNFMIAKPTASVTSGTYKAAQTVMLTCDTPDVDIYYTTDGQDPNRDGKVGEKYDPAKPITVGKDLTLKVKAFEGDAESEMATYDYKIDPNFTVAAPTSSPAPGKYTSVQEVTLDCATPNNEIYYTTDDKQDPDKSLNIGKKYTAGEKIQVSDSMTIRAIAYAGDAKSSVVKFEYVIEKPVVKEKIKSVKVTDLNPARRGEMPDTEAKSADPEKYTVEKVEWRDKTGKAISERFGADTEYYAYITLKSADGYEFDEIIKETGNVKVDGYSLTPVVSYNKNMITVATGYKTPSISTASADDNKITGIKSSYAKNATVTFNAIGAGSANEEIHGNERYIPVEYQVGSSDAVKLKTNKTTATGSYKVKSAGKYTMKVTFQKQVYDADAGDGGEWKDVADEIDVKSTSFKVTSKSPGGTPTRRTAKPTKTSSTRAKNARTADETPIGTMAAVCLLAGTAAVVMTVRRRKNR